MFAFSSSSPFPILFVSKEAFYVILFFTFSYHRDCVCCATANAVAHVCRMHTYIQENQGNVDTREATRQVCSHTCVRACVYVLYTYIPNLICDRGLSNFRALD